MSVHVSHVRSIKLGLDKNTIIVTRLINEYISSQASNALTHARQLFGQVPNKDIVLWSSIISAYTRLRHAHKALQLFSHMLGQSHQPNHFVYATAARACSENHLKLGEAIQACVIKSGFVPNYVVVETAFLDMYAKNGVLECARKIFDEMENRNVVTWNAMIAGYLHNDMADHGFNLFYQMKCHRFFLPDEFTVANVLGAVSASYLILGMQVHGYLIVGGFESSCINSLCNMYFQCGQVQYADQVIGMDANMMLKLIKIRGYVLNHRYHDTLIYIAHAKNIVEVVELDHTAIVPVLTACTRLASLRVGRQVHGLLIALVNSDSNFMENGREIIGCALIDMYCKCGSVNDAKKVFECWKLAQHVSCWNSLITGHICNGLIDEARKLWGYMSERNVISWTCMISGYVQNNMPEQGLNLLSKMYRNGERVDGNCSTFVTCIEACSQLSDLERGKQLHAKLIRALANADLENKIVGSALVDMYAKSSHLSYAQLVFERMLEKNVVTWTSIIMGYALNGIGSRALEMFQKMIETGIEPNQVTFVSLLTACSHCGLVDEGLLILKLMKEKYNMVLREDHYTCLIDMLGRVGRLEEAWSLVSEIEENEMINGFSRGTLWAALLGACQTHGNVEMGKAVAEKMLEKKQQVSTTYTSLSNMYAVQGMWNEVYKVRECQRRECYDAREPGYSQIYPS